MTWIDRFLGQEEMLSYVNTSRRALMLTRRDTQGVMSCELATYGIPVITSDLPICHEMFDDIANVSYVDEDLAIPAAVEGDFKKTTKFFAKNTIAREIDIINKDIRCY